MKILLNDNLSILEYLYAKSSGLEVELTMDYTEADCIVGMSGKDNFISKVLILPDIRNVDLDRLKYLSKFNTIISRHTLPTTEDITYSLEPYEDISLENLKISKVKNIPMSVISLKDFIMTKYKGNFYIEGTENYLGTKLKGNKTIVGLIKNSISE